MVTCWERTDHLALLYVMFSCAFVNFFTMMACGWWGIWLYGFLIFAFFLTFITEQSMFVLEYMHITYENHPCRINTWYKTFKKVNSNSSCTELFKNLRVLVLVFFCYYQPFKCMYYLIISTCINVAFRNNKKNIWKICCFNDDEY